MNGREGGVLTLTQYVLTLSLCRWKKCTVISHALFSCKQVLYSLGQWKTNTHTINACIHTQRKLEAHSTCKPNKVNIVGSCGWVFWSLRIPLNRFDWIFICFSYLILLCCVVLQKGDKLSWRPTFETDEKYIQHIIFGCSAVFRSIRNCLFQISDEPPEHLLLFPLEQWI